VSSDGSVVAHPLSKAANDNATRRGATSRRVGRFTQSSAG